MNIFKSSEDYLQATISHRGTNMLIGEAPIAELYAGKGNDTLIFLPADGVSGIGYLHAGFGHDTLIGYGAGICNYFGGSGSATMIANAADNWMYAGSGPDTFVLLHDDNASLIFGFKHGRDHIKIGADDTLVQTGDGSTEIMNGSHVVAFVQHAILSSSDLILA